MKKIILTLLLTLSALVNVNAVAAFSLDIDGNGTINASNDGLIIFKYLLNSNANNLHTTISSNAADDRKTTAQLKAYLDNSGDILDVDGNGTTNASNDGLIVFKYLLNSNANNLHTTIASNAPGSKTTTINLKAYLDQYISSAVITTGTATVTGTFKESDSGVGDQNGDGDDLDDGTYVETFITELIDGVEVDISKRVSTGMIDYNITNDVDPNLYSGDRPTELTAEQIAAANGAGTEQQHIDVLNTAKFSNYRITYNAASKQIWVLDTDENIGTIYARIQLPSTLQTLSTSLDHAAFQGYFLETIQAIWDLVNPNADLYSGARPTELTAEQIAAANAAVTGTEHVDVLQTAEFSNYRISVSYTNKQVWVVDTDFSIGTIYARIDLPNDFTGLNYSLDDNEFQAVFLEVIQAIWDLVNAPTAAEELVAIFALATSPTAFVDYPALDAEADGILQAERAQHIVDSLTNLNGVTVTYTINTTPKSFDVAKAGETTINVLQDSSSGGAVSLDTLSVFKDIYFQTIQAKWDILHTAGPTFESEVADIYANENAPTELGDFLQTYFEAEEVDGIYPDLIRLSSEDFTVTNFSFRGTNSIGYVELSNGDEVDEPSGTNYIDLEGEQLAGWALAIVQAIWDLVNPPTPVESEVADIYAADTPPTAYASGSVIDTDAQAVAQEGTVRDTFINRLSSSLYLTSNGYDTATGTGAEIEIRDNNNASLDPAVFVTTDAGAFAGMSGQAFSDFTFKIVLAIWHLEHPNYVAPTSHADRAAVLTAYNSIEGISNLTVKLANSNNLSIATVYLTWDLNGVAQALYYFSATNPTSTTDGEVRGDLSYYTPEQFETYRERLYNKLTDHILTPEEIAAALRAERIADLEGLDKDGVTVTQATAQADGFVVSTAGKSDVYFYANDYGSLTFEGLTTDQYIIYEAAIEAKRDEYILAAELAVLRTQRINELEALDKNGVVVVHHTRNNGEDTFSITKNPDQTFIHADVYGPGKVENQDATQYGNYRAAIIAQRDLYDPISDPKLQAVLETFYNGSEAAALDINNYGGQLSAVSTLLATAANAAFDNGLAAQETFLKLLAHGASFQGSPSKVLWDSTGNYYHIVTSNVGSGNGYFDIFLDDNHHYLPNANPGTVMVQNNFRHLAYHVIANLWHLADTTDAELRVFREDWLESYTTQNGAIFNKGKHGNGSDEYRASTATNSGEAITTLLYGGGVYLVEDLSLTQWVSFRDTYTFSVTTLLGL